MNDIAKLAVKITSDHDEVMRGLRQVEDGLGRLANSAASHGGRVGGFFDMAGSAAVAMGNLVASGVQSAVGAIGGLVSSGVTAVANLERSIASMQSMTAKEMVDQGMASDFMGALDGAKEKTKDLLQWTQKLAIESPFGKDDVTAALSRAQAFGFLTTQYRTTQEAQKAGVITAQRLTEATLNWAAATGKSAADMSRLTVIAGQIKAVGKLMGGDSLQLKQMGINLEGLIGKAIGKTTEQVLDMREKGLIPAELALKALVGEMENFGQAASLQSNSLGGLLASLDDLKTMALEKIGTPIADALRPYLQGAVAALQDPEILAKIEGLGQTLGSGLAAALETGKQALSSFMQVWSSMSEGFRDGGAAGAGVGLLAGLGFNDDVLRKAADIFYGLQDVIQGGWDRLTSVVASLASGVAAGESVGQLEARFLAGLGFPPGIAEGVGRAVDGVVGVIGEGARRIQTAVGVFKTLSGAGATTGTIASGVLIALGLNEDVAGKVRGAIDTIERGLADAKTKLQNAVAGFRTGIFAGAGVATFNVLTAIGVSEDAAVRAGQVMAGIASAITEGVSRVKGAIAALQGGQGAGGMLVALGMSPDVLNQIQSFVSTVVGVAGRLFEQFKAGWAGMVQNLAPVMPQLQELGGAVSRLGSVVVEILTPVAKLVGGVLVGAFVGLIGFVSGSLPGVGQVVSAVVQVITGAIELVTGILNGAVAIAKALILGDYVGAFESAKKAVSDIWAGMVNIIGGGFKLIEGLVNTFIGGVVGFFQGLYNTLVGHSIIPDLVNEAVRWFTDLPKRAGDALRSGVSTVVDGAREIGQGVVDKLKGFADSVWNTGEGLVNAFAGGIRAKIGEAIASISEMAARARSYLPGSDAERGPLSDLTASGRALFETFAAGMEMGSPAVIAQMEAAAEVMRANLGTLVGLAGAMAAAIDATNQFGRSLGNEREALADLQAASSSVASVVKAAADIKTAFDSLKGGSISGEARAWVKDMAAVVAGMIQDLQPTARSLDTSLLPLLDNLSKGVQSVSSVFGTTVSIVKTFLSDVNTSSFLGALGSPAAREWIASLVTMIIAWGDMLVSAASTVKISVDGKAKLGLDKLGEVLSSVSNVYGSTIGIVKTFLSDVNTSSFLGALGSGAAQKWIVDLVAMIVTWGDAIAAGSAAVKMTVDGKAREGLDQLGGVLSGVSSVFGGTVGIVKTFLSDVNTKSFLGALGSAAAQGWIVQLVAMIVGWGDGIAAAAAQVKVTVDAKATPALQELGASLSAVQGVIGPVIDIAKTLGELAKKGYTLNLSLAWAWIIILVSDAKWLAQAGAMAAAGFDKVKTEGLQPLATAIGATGQVVDTVLGLAKSMADVVKGGYALDLKTAWAWMFILVGDARWLTTAAAQAALGFEAVKTEGLAPLSTAIGDTRSILDGVFGIAKSLADMAKSGLKWTDAELQAGIVTAIDNVVKFAVRLRGAAVQALGLAGLSEEAQTALLPAIPALGRLGGVVGDLGRVVDGVFGIVRSFAAVVKDAVAWNGSDTQAGIILALSNLLAFALAMRQQVASSLNLAGLTEEAQAALLPAIPALGRLGSVIGDLGSVIDGVFGIVRSFAEAVKDKVDWSGPAVQQGIASSLDNLIQFGLVLRRAAIAALGLTDLASEATQAALPAVPALGRLGGVLGDLGGVVDSVFGLVGSFAKAVKDKLVWDDVAVQTAVTEGVGKVVLFGKALRQAAINAIGATEVEAMPALEKLAGILGDVSSIVSDGLGMAKLEKELLTFHGFDMTVFEPKLDTMIDQLIDLARTFGEKAAGAGITEEWQRASGVLSGIISDSLGSLRGGLDFFKVLFGGKGDEAAFIPSPGQLQPKITALLDLVKSVASQWQTGLAGMAGETGQSATESASAVEAVFGGFKSVVDAIQAAAGMNLGSSGFNNINFLIDWVSQTITKVEQAFSQGSAAVDAMARINAFLSEIGKSSGAKVGDNFIAGMAQAIRDGRSEIESSLLDALGGGQGTGQGTGTKPGGATSGGGAWSVTINQYVTAQMVLDPKAVALQIKEAMA